MLGFYRLFIGGPIKRFHPYKSLDQKTKLSQKTKSINPHVGKSYMTNSDNFLAPIRSCT